MSNFVEACSRIRELAARADVHGIPRISITFDTPADRERFKEEVRRDIGPIYLSYNSPLNLSEASISGVKVRII